MSFGSRLKELRKSKKLTQEALAGMLFVSRQTVTKWECDKSVPDEETMNKIASIFSVSSSYLMGIKKNKKENNIKIMKISLISIIALLVLSIIYVVIHFLVIVPNINKNEIIEEERRNRLVASYITFNEEVYDLASLKNSTSPYLILTNEGIISNRLINEKARYVFYVPADYYNDLYYNKIIYDEIAKSYKNERTTIKYIDNYKEKFYDTNFEIVKKESYKSLTIFSYDARLELLKEESFYRDENNNLCSSITGALNKNYLDSYYVSGAFQYTILLEKKDGNNDILSIAMPKSELTFLVGSNWREDNSTFETKFII